MKMLIADIAKDTQLIAPQHTVSCSLNEDGYIFADPLCIRQMLRIFLDNSIKYTPDGGRIEISSSNDGKQMIVKITDNGIGIDKERAKENF